MTTLYSKKSSFLFFLIFVFLGIQNTKAQENFSMLIDPDFTINIDPDSRWSYNFNLSNRDIIYEDGEYNFDAKHLQLSHFTSYEVGFYSKLSLGIRYRFKEIFDKDIQDEVRIVEQFGHSRKYNSLKVAHRARFEQRLREITTYRTRYRFSVELPLSGQRVDPNEFFIIGNTEALFSVGSEERPKLEQRFSLALGNEIWAKTKATLGLQYRYEDYTGNPASELFITSEVILSL
ncbi:DUF2490 domain-containing protein [Salegentibacter sp. JZCK2]|uniref:DUF2490 domain-containing protein n=1 Tax=Salegentibacter tibetensis TaxID=2873600 RepID=UPI001CCC9BE0|nr:DUF2490 domain-containing protein [Salegentibacter tibetensis]MBZ9729591.1 DUF2490 domain-containing protein [Salegentibacter tibetensis]